MSNIAVGAAVGIGSAVAVGWAGLRIPPTPFPSYPDCTPQPETMSLPTNLPAPVERHVRAALGSRLPIIESAVLTARGSLRFAGLSFPARLRFAHAARHGYRHYIECTWFGYPLLRVNEWYLDGHFRQELPVGVVGDEPKADQSANLAFWGELAFWLPSVAFTDPRARWEPIDATTARLVVPFGARHDQLTVTFDERTGLFRWVEASRYRAPADSAKIQWRVEARGWRTFHGMLLPTPVALTWQDQGTPWLVINVEEVVYNVDVSAYIRARGP